jgi:hypothetical protein
MFRCNAEVKVPRRAWWRAGMLCLAVGAALLALGFVVVAYLFPSPPATCKELVEYFQSRGMKLSWQVMNSNPPTMRVNCENCAMREVMNPSPWGGRIRREQPSATVVQLPSKREAHERAGDRTDAFAWGCFYIFGDEEALREIRKRCGWLLPQ